MQYGILLACWCIDPPHIAQMLGGKDQAIDTVIGETERGGMLWLCKRCTRQVKRAAESVVDKKGWTVERDMEEICFFFNGIIFKTHKRVFKWCVPQSG